MNERIKELWNKAAVGTFPSGSNSWESQVNFIEKFSELIVRGCVEQIVAKGTDWVDFAPSQTGVRPEYWAMAQQINQHFGVEE